ncbi:MAG: hypothetical protein KGI70_01570 [Patescibacteria group bacterium]|nr:hypothetical protein [Patescibacteria group bacterium]
MTAFDVLRIFLPSGAAFFIGVAMTPFVSHYLYKYKMWKPRGGKVALDGRPAEEFNKLHVPKEVGTPRFGGIIVWGSVLLTAALFQILATAVPDAFSGLAFVSRSQTWVPLAALMLGALVGLLDDLYEVQGTQGLRLRVRLGFVTVVALVCAWWFFSKLGVVMISVPWGSGEYFVGSYIIPIFVFTTLLLYAGGVIDGIDGLSGGVFSTIFAAYAALAFFQHQFDIAALCAAIMGGLLAFLWFNIPPARFYLTETGTMGLTMVLAVVAFLTDAQAGGRGLEVLPIIAAPLFITVASNIVQIFWKKIFGRKLLRIAPLHHHFEAIGWPPYKVTMRYWIVSVILAIIGLALALL